MKIFPGYRPDRQKFFMKISIILLNFLQKGFAVPAFIRFFNKESLKFGGY